MKNLLRLFSLISIVFCSVIHLDAQCVEWLDCPDASVQVCDSTPNDPQLWNATALWDPVHEQQDLCEGQPPLKLNALLPCGNSYDLSWTLFLDLNNDGTTESVLRSDQVITPGFFPFDNLNNPGYSWTDSVQFDLRPVPPDHKFFFSTMDSLKGDSLEVSLFWNTSQGSFTATPQLPLGQHRVEWVLTQGNESDTCLVEFEISDCKAPTVVCINGLSVNIIPTGMITLWASDFLLYGEDNCTPADQLEYGIRRAGTGNGFPVDSTGLPQTSVTFMCPDLGSWPIELWCRDKTGNASYCNTVVIVNDGFTVCAGPPLAGICFVGHCIANGIEDVFLNISGSGFPSYSVSDSSGCISTTSLPVGQNATLTPSKNDNPLNGVSTYDLVLIGKHILGQEPFDSPYKMIAADVNKSGSISTFDIVELRRLILGINEEFPNNTSWRFVPEDFNFPNPMNPFQTAFPESLQINQIQGFPVNFLGIKIGDVNCTAIANAFQDQVSESRAAIELSVLDTKLQTGAMQMLPVYISTPGQLAGAQFALQYDPEVLDIQNVRSSLSSNAWDWHSPTPGELRIVWAEPEGKVSLPGESLFELVIRAKREVKLSETLSLNEQSLQAEIYDQEGARPLELVFRNDVEEIQTLTPQPNPFTDQLRFPLRLVEGGQVFLRITDMQGRVVYEQSKLLSEGPQWLDVNTGSWPTGMYTWQVILGERVYSGKVVKR
jgi:hypothetical protein